MSATTIGAIMQRFQTVLEAAPISLERSGDPFTDTGTPGGMTDRTYRLVHAGLVHSTPMSAGLVVRIERITVTIMRAMQFDGYVAQIDVQDQLDAVERAIVADLVAQSINVNVEKGSRKVTRPKNANICVGAINFLVDFDFNESQA